MPRMPSFSRPLQWNPDVALDVGTAITRVSASETSARVEAPSSIDDRAVLSFGAVTDEGALVELLSGLLRRMRFWGMPSPRALACAPSDATDSERAVLIDCVARAGAAEVAIVPEPLAAAVGSGMDVGLSYAQCIVDFGEGTTDCAIIQSGMIAASCAVRVGCGDLRRAVQAHALLHGVDLSGAEAEHLVRAVGIGARNRPVGSVNGDFRVSEAGVAAAMEPVTIRIVDALQTLLSEIPSRMHLEVIESGLVLAGGGALLPGMRERLEQETSLSVVISPDPLGSVISGAQTMLATASETGFWKS